LLTLRYLVSNALGRAGRRMQAVWR
jgi:hypothetical protein